MDRALARGEVTAVTAAWREAYVAAHVSRDWPGMLAVGDAALRAGRATGSARRLRAPRAARLSDRAAPRAPAGVARRRARGGRGLRPPGRSRRRAAGQGRGRAAGDPRRGRRPPPRPRAVVAAAAPAGPPGRGGSRRVVCSVRHEPIRAAHPRAAAGSRPLRAQYPEDGGPREGRRQEAPPALEDPQVPGDRPPPGGGRRDRRLRGEGERGRGDGRRRRAESPHHHRGGGAREDRPAARACSGASPRPWRWWTTPTTCTSSGAP